ncbi:MAG: hypothetical protein JO121_06530 [Deltaproteobacteria bacterium]|jgi:hypothetical protein|nr:hypothetical protein [Deltaproteobacteria bacterium]
MTKKITIALGALLWLVAAGPAVTLAADFFVYPRQGQSVEQQERDTWECRAWATNTTGFDPAARPRAVTPPPIQQAPRGGALTGAAGGAGLGAGLGAITGGNAGRGAAIGAVGGGLLGAMRRNDQVRQNDFANQQWQQQNVAHHEANRSAWTRAVAACLSGRGYTVK